MLVVDLYDPGEKQLIWRREATKTIDLKRERTRTISSNAKDIVETLGVLNGRAMV